MFPFYSEIGVNMLPFWKLKTTGRYYYTVNKNESNIFCCHKQILKASPALKSLSYTNLYLYQ